MRPTIALTAAAVAHARYLLAVDPIDAYGRALASYDTAETDGGRRYWWLTLQALSYQASYATWPSATELRDRTALVEA